MKIAIINGPNLNMLAYREKEIYGDYTYEDIEKIISENVHNDDQVVYFQSNHEGAIIDFIHKITIDNYDSLIINPGAYAHYSYAIYDALLIFKGIKVEVHLSDISKRDEFRKTSITSNACEKMISGFQINSYLKALEYINTKK